MAPLRTLLRLRDPPPKDPDYVFNDTQHMMKVLFDAGYVATYRAVKTAWEQHSSDSCATWLTVPTGKDGDEMILGILLNGTDEGDVSLNGRAPGPFLVNAATGEKVKHYWR